VVVATAHDSLIQLVGPDRHAELLAVVKDVVRAVPEMSGRYGDEELEQLVRAFGGVLSEALEGDSRERLELLVETAVPAFVADGQTVSSLARASGMFAVAVSASLVLSVPEEERAASAAWLAAFFGEYTQAVVDEALRAGAP